MNEEHKKNDCLFYNDPESLLLESGQIINGHDIAYKTYGTLNSNKDNAILICHALSVTNMLQAHTQSRRKRVGGKEWLVKINQ